MKILAFSVTLIIGLVGGILAGRKITSAKYERMYPPELIKILASNAELLGPMNKQELEDIQKDMKATLGKASNDWDLIIFAEGQLANDFCKTMDQRGADAARGRAMSKLINFRERYQRGMNLPHGWDKVADAMYEHTQYATSEQVVPPNGP